MSDLAIVRSLRMLGGMQNIREGKHTSEYVANHVTFAHARQDQETHQKKIAFIVNELGF